MYGVTKDKLYVEPRESLNPDKNPAVFVNLPSDEVADLIVKRSAVIKEIIDVNFLITYNKHV